MSNTVNIKTIKDMVNIFGQPNMGGNLIRFLPDPHFSKTNWGYAHYVTRIKDSNKLKRQKDGWFKITVTDNPVEKLEWCFTTLGRGSNNPKAMWRTHWIQLEDVRLGFQSYFHLYLHPDSAALYRLVWGVAEAKSDCFAVTCDYEKGFDDWV